MFNNMRYPYALVENPLLKSPTSEEDLDDNLRTILNNLTIHPPTDSLPERYKDKQVLAIYTLLDRTENVRQPTEEEVLKRFTAELTVSEGCQAEIYLKFKNNDIRVEKGNGDLLATISEEELHNAQEINVYIMLKD